MDSWVVTFNYQINIETEISCCAALRLLEIGQTSLRPPPSMASKGPWHGTHHLLVRLGGSSPSKSSNEVLTPLSSWR